MATAKKIRSIKNTQKITRAMEMVSASKMRKAQDRMQHTRPYAQKILQVISHVARSHPEYNHPFLATREIKRVGFIVVTTDRGLCGGLNTVLLRSVINKIRELKNQSVEISLCLIGRKSENFFRRMGGQVLAQTEHLGDAPKLMDITGPLHVMLQAWKSSDPATRIDSLYLCANNYVNTMTQKPYIQQVLPIEPSSDEQLKHHWDYIYEPDNAKELLDHLLVRYVESQVYRGLIENIACEQAARMIAMKNATENASDLIDELETIYHKARQGAITRELTEIVAGAAAV